MDIDEARRDDQAGCVHCLGGLRGSKIANLDNPAGPHTDVGHSPRVSGPVDQLAVANDQIKVLRERKAASAKEPAIGCINTSYCILRSRNTAIAAFRAVDGDHTAAWDACTRRTNRHPSIGVRG